MRRKAKGAGGGGVPEALAPLFWDVNPRKVHARRHRSFVVRRVLSRGTYEQVDCLRRWLGDEAIRETLVRTRGRGLTRRQVRFWQVVFDFEEDLVSSWLSDGVRDLFEGRQK